MSGLPDLGSYHIATRAEAQAEFAERLLKVIERDNLTDEQKLTTIKEMCEYRMRVFKLTT